jgi:chromosome segregation ATPase
MKLKIGIFILVVFCVGLGIALIAIKKSAKEQHDSDAGVILDFSNQLVTANENINDLHQVNLTLTNQLAVSEQQASSLSNNLNETSSALAATKTSLQSAEEQVAALNGRIADLEAQNKSLDERAAALTNTIAALNAQIADTESKLSNAETNDIFLEKELAQQMAQRAELEHKFNDLNQVRTQVKKLRDEAFVVRRLQLMRVSATEQKGATLLNHPVSVTNTAPASASGKSPRYDLNVEVGSDGSVHVIAPTNNAPATNSP